MMSVENPILSLKNLNDIETRIKDNTALSSEYEEIDLLVSSIGGTKNYLKDALMNNGFRSFDEFKSQRSEATDLNKVRTSRMLGTITGTIEFLKAYAIQNRLFS